MNPLWYAKLEILCFVPLEWSNNGVSVSWGRRSRVLTPPIPWSMSLFTLFKFDLPL